MALIGSGNGSKGGQRSESAELRYEYLGSCSRVAARAPASAVGSHYRSRNSRRREDVKILVEEGLGALHHHRWWIWIWTFVLRCGLAAKNDMA